MFIYFQFSTKTRITYSHCYAFALFFFRVWSCHFVSILRRWLGGSFAKLGFRVGLCGFVNVPIKSVGYFITKVITIPTIIIPIVTSNRVFNVLVSFSCFPRCKIMLSLLLITSSYFLESAIFCLSD